MHGLVVEGRAAWTRRWARRRLRRMDAVVLDTETTDLFGEIVQVAVVDLAGRVLLDTLVRPQGSIAAEAEAVHGITAEDVVDAPSFAAIAPQLLDVTRGRVVLAYNAHYDAEVVTAALAQAGYPDTHLSDRRAWRCLMRARSRCTGLRWAALGGEHQALGDCRAALEVLRALPGSRPGRDLVLEGPRARVGDRR